MTNFDSIYNKIIALYEQTENPTGKEVAQNFYKTAKNALGELINKYFDAVKHNATKYSLGKLMDNQDIITPEKFISDVLEPLAIDNKDGVVVELPIHFTPEMFADFISEISKIARVDMPDLVHIAPMSTEFADKNVFGKVHPELLKHIYPRGVKKEDRINYPGGRTGFEVLKWVASRHVNDKDLIKKIMNTYRIESTHPLNEQGDPNSVLGFLAKHVFPHLKALNWPIKDLKSATPKWGSVYLKDFMTAASEATGIPYNSATAWKGRPEETYATKQNLRELLDQ
jgi:hypothetical protein